MFHTALAVHQIVVPELCPTGGGLRVLKVIMTQRCKRSPGDKLMPFRHVLNPGPIPEAYCPLGKADSRPGQYNAV